MTNCYIPYATREYVDQAKRFFVMEDITTGYLYAICIEDGKFVSTLLPIAIEYVGEPLLFVEGEDMDMSNVAFDMVYPDGDKKRIDSNDVVCYDQVVVTSTELAFGYEFYGQTYTVSVPVTIERFNPDVTLIDFDYTVNGDGTYTITGWKQTLNGEPSTDMVIPYNSLVIL